MQLLDYEARASEQVPLLLKMGQDQTALTKAIDSGDTDLGLYMFLSGVDFNRYFRFFKMFYVYSEAFRIMYS